MNATVNVGQTYTFSCNASNFLHRQWLHSLPPHSPIILNNRSDGLVEINANLDLILRNIQIKNRGTYECVVVNHLGRQSLINNLAVIGEKLVIMGLLFL